MEQEKSFEAYLEELEGIVNRLESGSIPLSDMVALYERGKAIGARCAALLDAYEARLETIAPALSGEEEEA